MTLVELLDCGGVAAAACLGVILAGGEFRIWEEKVSVRNLLGIYRRRERYVRQHGLASLGLAEAIAGLEACSFDQVLMGSVKGSQPPYSFHLALAPDASHVVTCLGIGEERLPSGPPPDLTHPS